MFHAGDAHSAHWSEDFVEHVRTVHFSLVAVCLALVGLLQFEKPKDVREAQRQLQDIKSTVDTWDSDQGAGAALRNSLSNEGGLFFGAPSTGFEIFQQNVMLTNSPLVWVPSERAGEGQAVSPNNFLSDIAKKPSSLAEFRDFWNLLDRKPQVWSVDREHLSDKLVIVSVDGTVSLMNYTLGQVNGGQMVDATPSDERQRRILSNTLHIAPPECVYFFAKGQNAMLLPVAVTSKKKLEGQPVLIATHPYWKTGAFSMSFAELEAATTGKQNASFEAIASLLADEAAKPKSDSFEIFSVKFPVEAASRWGIVLILGIQIYLWIHLYEVSPKLKEGDPGWDVAWIGVYQSVPARILFFASTCSLPLLTIAALGYHAFVALGSHAGRTASAKVWIIYVSAVLTSLVLSIAISKGIPRHYDRARRTTSA